jgi:hypothetical protein
MEKTHFLNDYLSYFLGIVLNTDKFKLIVFNFTVEDKEKLGKQLFLTELKCT